MYRMVCHERSICTFRFAFRALPGIVMIDCQRGKEWWAETSPLHWPIAMNAMVFIPIFTFVWWPSVIFNVLCIFVILRICGRAIEESIWLTALFSPRIWRVFFEAVIHSQAVEYATSETRRKTKGKATPFALNVTKYKESYWKTLTNSILMIYGVSRWDWLRLAESVWPNPFQCLYFGQDFTWHITAHHFGIRT